jgi:hypothetical protein
MTITFENDSDVIVYAFERIISFARENQYLFVANCVWWIAGIIGLESGLITFIDNLESRKRVHQSRGISSIPRDLTEDQRLYPVLEEAGSGVETSDHGRNTRQRNKVNPLPQTKNQLKKARKLKRLQDNNRKEITNKNKRLQEKRIILRK